MRPLLNLWELTCLIIIKPMAQTRKKRIYIPIIFMRFLEYQKKKTLIL